MLIIHPQDRTTAMLTLLYKGKEGRIMDNHNTNAEIKRALHHTSAEETIMILGHGSEKGLYSRKDDTRPGFDRLLLQHQHAFYLRKHPGHLIGIWCHADCFALKEGLHGLFTGMIISEMEEAIEYRVETSTKELEQENVKLAQRLRFLLDESVPLQDFPARMTAFDEQHSPLTTFNYQNFYYL